MESDLIQHINGEAFVSLNRLLDEATWSYYVYPTIYMPPGHTLVQQPNHAIPPPAVYLEQEFPDTLYAHDKHSALSVEIAAHGLSSPTAQVSLASALARGARYLHLHHVVPGAKQRFTFFVGDKCFRMDDLHAVAMHVSAPAITTGGTLRALMLYDGSGFMRVKTDFYQRATRRTPAKHTAAFEMGVEPSINYENMFEQLSTELHYRQMYNRELLRLREVAVSEPLNLNTEIDE